MERRYIKSGTGDRIAMITLGQTEEIHYYIPDRLGHVIALVDGAGAITDQYLYSPFGIEEPLNASGNPFRYTGRKFGEVRRATGSSDGPNETGLYYYRARYGACPRA